MKIIYRTKKLQKVCEDGAAARRAYGNDIAVKIHLRIREIKAAETVEQMVLFRTGRCHALTGDRVGQFALDLTHPYRLIFEKQGEQIQIVKIIEIADYH